LEQIFEVVEPALPGQGAELRAPNHFARQLSHHI
jgi:hypothetical protein